MFKGINSDFLYNNLRTIESEKSQEMESQIVLDENLSFMPKPLRKNPTLQYLGNLNETKKVSFNEEPKVLYS